MYHSGYFKDLPYNVYHSAHPGYSKEETNITTALEQVDYFAALLRRSKLVVLLLISFIFLIYLFFLSF